MMQLNPDVKSVWTIYYIRRTLFFMAITLALDYLALSEIPKWPFFYRFYTSSSFFHWLGHNYSYAPFEIQILVFRITCR